MKTDNIGRGSCKLAPVYLATMSVDLADGMARRLTRLRKYVDHSHDLN